MLKKIDEILNSITMYRLVLYFLILLLIIAGIYSILGILPFSLVSLGISVLVLLSVSLITNVIFANVFQVPVNAESVYITALILALILTPIKSAADFPLFIWAGILSMATKFILAINKKHIFNPVAIAVVLTAYAFNGSASWWIGTASMLPFLLLGVFIVRRIRRFDLVYYFFLSAFVSLIVFSLLSGQNILSALHDTIFASSIFFFAFVMLTEPLTTPPTKTLQSLYGAFVGFLFVPEFHIVGFYTTPELALVIGNAFSYLISPKHKIFAIVKEKIQTTPNRMDFLLDIHKNVSFKPGQYMEWTLPPDGHDSRGNRRFFTIASSPTEDYIRLGVKFYGIGSSYKKAMSQLDRGSVIVGSQISGDFTLPRNKNQKLVFIAGGIGITPFRSMLKYLIDTNQKRDIVVFYTNKTAEEIAYTDVLKEAKQKLGIKTIYTLTDTSVIPQGWPGNKGRINSQMIQAEVPDYLDRIYYISGPTAMVSGAQDFLLTMGIPKKHIKKDYFAGL